MFFIAVPALAALAFGIGGARAEREPPPHHAANAGAAGSRQSSDATTPAKAATMAPALTQYSLTAKGRSLVLRSPTGQTLAKFPAELRVGYNGRAARMSARWEQRSETVYTARAEGADAHVTFRLEAHPDDPLVTLDVDVEYQRAVHVGYETWTLSPQKVTGTMLDRAYTQAPLKKRSLFVDRWTPHRGQWHTRGAKPTAAFALLGDEGVEAIRASSHKVVFEFDHKRNHEHSVHDACYDEYDRDREYRSMSETKRAAKTKAHHRVTFAVGEAALPVKDRWPDGRRAALSIVDHADGANRHTLRALMYGSSRKGPQSKNVGGLIGHGVAITKTAFATPSQLGEPRFRALTDALNAAGSEIAPHSLTPGTDSRARIAEGMASAFGSYSPRSWVDHQPDTNCESVNNRGGRAGHKYNVVETLEAAGLRYAWEAPDYLGWRGLNFFRPQKRSERVRFFYPAQAVSESSSDMWLFRSAWLFLPHKKVTQRLRRRALDQLEKEHGLFVAHTYFGTTKSIDDEDGRSLFHKGRRGELVIRSDYDRAFRRLGARHRAGTLWVAPMRDLGDWMRHWARTEVRVVDATHIEVIQPLDDAPDFTLSLTATRGAFASNEAAAVRTTAGRTVFEMATPVYETGVGVSFTNGKPRVARR